MLYTNTTAAEKRKTLQTKLKEGELLSFPGAFFPLAAKLIEEKGFGGFYFSGGAFSAALGLPDVGLTTASEVSAAFSTINRTVSLPGIVDADTGFGEAINVARTVQEFEEAGAAGCHLEDQRNPKRCGHLDKKELVPEQEMLEKIQAAVKARRDKDFLLIARTDARSSEGLAPAIARAKAYVDAGADMIFPEALVDEGEFAAFRKELSVPLVANMTEFGQSKLLSRKTLVDVGYNIVLYPVTTLRLALHSIAAGLEEIRSKGHQRDILGAMYTREELYGLLGYEDYGAFDSRISNFSLPKGDHDEREENS